MNVNKIAVDIIRNDAQKRAQGSVTPQTPAEPSTPVRGSDAVQISDAGRAMAGDHASAQSATTVEPSRAEQIRSNILSGAYNSLGMADQVARAVIRSGDI